MVEKNGKEKPPNGLSALEKLLKELDNQFTKEELEVLRRVFSEEEIAALKRVAARERAFIAIGYLGGGLKTILTYVGFFIAAYISLKVGLAEWIRETVLK